MAKQGGFGAQLKITVASTLTVVAQVEEVDFPEQEKDLVDVTTHDSTNGYAEHMATGLFKLNKMSCVLIWDDANATHAAIQAAFASLVPMNMTVVSAGATETIAFSGFVVKLGRESKMKDAYKCKVEIQPTGAPTIT
jgi:predicted secreted protein